MGYTCHLVSQAEQQFLRVLQPSATSSQLLTLSSADLCGAAPEIAASEVQICRNADGSPVVLGKGSFGQVCMPAVSTCGPPQEPSAGC